MAPWSTGSRALALLQEDDNIPTAAAKGPWRVRPSVWGYLGSHPQFTMTGASLSDVDISGNMVSHRHQDIGTLEQGQRAAERAFYQPPDKEDIVGLSPPQDS